MLLATAVTDVCAHMHMVYLTNIAAVPVNKQEQKTSTAAIATATAVAFAFAAAALTRATIEACHFRSEALQ